MCFELQMSISDDDLFDEELEEDGDRMTVEDFRAAVESGGFVDDDGVGHAINENLPGPYVVISPSDVDLIPVGTTHVIWFNR